MSQNAGPPAGGLPRSRGELWEALSGAHAAIRLPILALVRFSSDQAPLRAAALTYTTLLSIVPVFAFGLAILRGLGFDQGIYEYFLEQLGPVFTPDVRDKLFTFIGRVNYKTLGATGLGVFLVTIVLTLNGVERSLNAIFEVKRQRPLVRKFTDYFSLIFFTPLLLGIIISATTLFKIRGFVASMGSYWILGTGAELLLKLVPLIGSIFLITLLLIVLPNTRIRLLPGLLGGVVGGVLTFFLQWGYVSFQVAFTGKMAIYGALAQLPILMVWIYLGWCILFYSAELAAIAQGRGIPAREGGLPPEGEGRWEAALRVMTHLASRSETREPPWTPALLAVRLDYPAEILNTIVNLLKEAGLVAETKEGDSLLPARSPSAIAAIEIFDAVECGPNRAEDPENAGAGALLREMHEGRRAALEGITLAGLLETESSGGTREGVPAADPRLA